MITIVANWKMRPQTHEDAKALWDGTTALAEKYPAAQIIVCPAFVFLPDLHKSTIANIKIGAQDIFWAEEGAYTGEVSPRMLSENDVEYVLIGHSKRRYTLGETDEMINKKIHEALKHNITPIVLIGERYQDDVREDVLVDQMSQSFAGMSSGDFQKILICYEPAWAISSHADGKAADPGYVASGIALIQDVLKKNFGVGDNMMPRFLYGGSVDAEHGRTFLDSGNISGFIVGGASVDIQKFE